MVGVLQQAASCCGGAIVSGECLCEHSGGAEAHSIEDGANGVALHDLAPQQLHTHNAFRVSSETLLSHSKRSCLSSCVAAPTKDDIVSMKMSTAHLLNWPVQTGFPRSSGQK